MFKPELTKAPLSVARWIQATNGNHLKDDVRPVARLGDGGWISIQASRLHKSEPRLDNARRYHAVEIGVKGVMEGPESAAMLLEDYLRDHRRSTLYDRVPIAVAEDYVSARGGIIV